MNDSRKKIIEVVRVIQLEMINDFVLVVSSYFGAWIHKVTATPSKQFRLGI